jgi:hypothetical protein
MRLDSGRLQRAVEILRDLHLVAGRVDGIHPDHPLEMIHGLLACDVPVRRLTGSGSGYHEKRDKDPEAN